MPVAVMLGSLFLTARTIWRVLTTKQKKVYERVRHMENDILEAVINEFIEARPELKVAASGDVRIEDFDEGKATFTRALCELGRKPTDNELSSANSTALNQNVFSVGGSDKEDQTGRFDISASLRQKLQACFGYIVRQSPLPPGIRQSLRDPVFLAKLCMEKRKSCLRKLIGSSGEDLLKEVVARTLETYLDDAMVAVLGEHEDSQIDVLSAEKLASSAVLFFDQQLNDQIMSFVACEIDSYRERLLTDLKTLFESYLPTASKDGAEKLHATLEAHEKAFKKFVDDSQLIQFELAMIDTTSDGTANCGFIPFMQTLGLLPPLDVLLSVVGKNHFVMQLEELMHQVKGETNGHLVLRRHDTVSVLMKLTDTVRDGRIDSFWWNGFVQVCKDIYIYHEDGTDEFGQKYPCSIEDLYEVWAEETRGDSLLMPVERITDAVLARLMTKNGKKKLWREAFVLMARHLHLWPEIPLDDTIIEVLNPEESNCTVMSHLAPKILPKLDEHERIVEPLKPMPEETMIQRGLHKDAPRKGISAFEYDDYLLDSLGDFSPEQGFAMLNFPRKELTRSATAPWCTLDWDRDAKQSECGADTSDEPPFPGPLQVYLIFYNLNPQEPGHRKSRKWLNAQRWEKQEGMKVPEVTSMEEMEKRSMMSTMSSGMLSIGGVELTQAAMPAKPFHGFAQPSWMAEEMSDLEPITEVYMKEFQSSGSFGSPESIIKLMGMNSKEPVMVFFQTQRVKMPNPNCFEEAHTAPFLRSKFFKKHWLFFDSAEEIRKYDVPSADGNTEDGTESVNAMLAATEGRSSLISKAMTTLEKDEDVYMLPDMGHLQTGAIDASPDGPDLITALVLKKFSLDGKSEPEPEPKNDGLKVLMPERVRLGLTREHKRTHSVKPHWLRPVCPGFYVEDMDFVEMDVVKHQHFMFKVTYVRGGIHAAGPAKVKNMQVLQNNIVQWCSDADSNLNAELWTHESGALVISFDQRLEIDELDFTTYGGAEDPCRWEIFGGDGPKLDIKWDATPLAFRRDMDYPLDEDQKSELVRIGKKQTGSIWHRAGQDWLQMRGLWFDGFCEMLAALKLRMDRPSAWSLWRKMLSFKHEPIAHQYPPGFISMFEAKEALSSIIKASPFLSDQTFHTFQFESRLDLQDIHVLPFYEHICANSPDYLGAHNLVGWRDFCVHIKSRVENSRPYLRKGGTGDQKNHQFVVGSIWFEPLYQIVVSSMPEVPRREEIREYYESYTHAESGLMPLDRVYDLIAKLGRPGLKYESFVDFVRRLGFKADPKALTLTFNQIDIDQNQCLDSNEAISGINFMLRTVLPDQVLRLGGLHNDQIFVKVVWTVVGLIMVFAFLLFSFVALVGGHTTQVQSVLQSALAFGAATYARMEQSGNQDEQAFRDYVMRLLEQCIGVAARHAHTQADRKTK
eukprot:TRINITY_DN20181_c0_g1_i2.p1 TRINITY_DN20181_c0_g1~~TRINITY_DN20181_c0_g1_i2.p1  ORF type:complete len:1414 (-),score=372.64 TRINITY_DN20181_c0_g1_i2:376-4617(-)